MIITPQFAAYLLRISNNLPNQREIDWESVNSFIYLIKRGALNADPPISFCLDLGRIRLHNGQHRLHGIVFAKEAVDINIEMHPMTDECLGEPRSILQ